MKPYIINLGPTYVHVVLEYPLGVKGDPVVHGVFANREYAETQAKILPERHKKVGYIAVLKKRIKGY